MLFPAWCCLLRLKDEVYPYSVLIFVCILQYCFNLPDLFHIQASLVWVMNLVAESHVTLVKRDLT